VAKKDEPNTTAATARVKRTAARPAAGNRPPKARAASVRTRAAPQVPADAPAEAPASNSMVMSLARQLQSWTSSMLGGVGSAADVALTLAGSRLQRPGPKAAVEKGAALLRDLRQAAGLSLDDLGRVLELDNPSLLGLVESGKVGLPFELILRLTSVLGRNDPVGFLLQMTRAYNPGMWKALEGVGIGKLLVQAGREREFANIYRSKPAARQLSDKDFAAALAFSAAAFESALVFLGQQKKVEPPAASQ
jgi:transcriptional regulator with XRE-family HTH domain